MRFLLLVLLAITLLAWSVSGAFALFVALLSGMVLFGIWWVAPASFPGPTPAPDPFNLAGELRAVRREHRFQLSRLRRHYWRDRAAIVRGDD